MATDTDRANGTRVAVLAVLLGACAGSVDVLAFFGLGKAFAGIVTRNMVTAGYGIAAGNSALTLVLLAGASAAMGGQITWALRIHQTTTLVLFKLRSAAPSVPVVLLAAAIAVHLHHVRKRVNASDRP